jgi:hypothetical protein
MTGVEGEGVVQGEGEGNMLIVLEKHPTLAFNQLDTIA